MMINPPQRHLEASPKSRVALDALAAQGQYGAMTRVANEHGIARCTAYARRDEATAVIEAYYEARAWDVQAIVPVDRRQIERFIVSQYVVSHNTIRGIEDALPITYPGVTFSYGAIQSILTEAQCKALLFNASVPLGGISAIATDEMFSQGHPVLASVDLDSGYLIDLALRRHRDAETWAALLEEAKTRGLDVQIVVKDAGSGMAAGVTKAFPNAEQRDDLFHAIYVMGKVRFTFERRAYGALEAAEKTRLAVKKVAHKRHASPEEGAESRRKASAKLGAATRKANKLMTQHDVFEQAMREVVTAVQIIDPHDGTLNTQARANERLIAAAQRMQEMGSKKAQKVGRYIENRAPGLALYIRQVGVSLAVLTEQYRELPVQLAISMWQFSDDLSCGRRPWDTTRMKKHLQGANAMLHMLLDNSGQVDALHASINAVMEKRHRASSAIEGFNAALRPYLYIHKGVTQGFLELFRAYHNLKTRRWGRHKGTSAHECITGENVGDWLTMLGYPPSGVSIPLGVSLH